MLFVLVAMLVALMTLGLQLASAQKKEVVWSADEKTLADQIHSRRTLADDVRAGTTKEHLDPTTQGFGSHSPPSLTTDRLSHQRWD